MWVIIGLVYAGLLVYASLTPTSAPTGSSTMVVLRRWLFNLLHVPAYAVLTILLAWAIGTPGRTTRVTLLLAGALALAVGGGTEILQQYVDGRYATWLDAGLNAVGCAIGLWAATRIDRFARRANTAEPCIEESTG